MMKFDNLKAGIKGFVLGAGLTLILLYVRPKVDQFIHEARMKFDDDYAVEYQVKELANKYGWTYVEGELED